MFYVFQVCVQHPTRKEGGDSGQAIEEQEEIVHIQSETIMHIQSERKCGQFKYSLSNIWLDWSQCIKSLQTKPSRQQRISLCSTSLELQREQTLSYSQELKPFHVSWPYLDKSSFRYYLSQISEVSTGLTTRMGIPSLLTIQDKRIKVVMHLLRMSCAFC